MLQQNQRQNKAYCVGLDASLSSFGVYCLPIGHDEWYGWSTLSTPADGGDTRRVIEMAQDVLQSIASLPYPVEAAVFEDYGPINRTSGKIAQRAEMCGIVKRALLQGYGVPVFLLKPNSLKQFAHGKGNASKEQMLDAANRLGYYPDTHDEADAFHAARAGVLLLAGEKIGVPYERINPV